MFMSKFGTGTMELRLFYDLWNAIPEQKGVKWFFSVIFLVLGKYWHILADFLQKVD